MKNNLLSILFCWTFGFLPLQAQTISIDWGSAHDYPKGITNQRFYADEQGYISTYYPYALTGKVPATAYFVRYDKQINEQSKQAIEVRHQQTITEAKEFFKSDGQNFGLISTAYDKTSKSVLVYLSAINSKGTVVKSEIVNEVGNVLKPQDVWTSVCISPDSSLIMVVSSVENAKEKRKPYTLTLLSKNLKVIAKKMIELPELYTSRFAVPFLDNKGNLHFPFTNTKEAALALLSYVLQKDQIVETKIGTPDMACDKVFLYQQKENLLSGFTAYRKGSFVLEGVLHFNLDIVSWHMESETRNLFGENILLEYYNVESIARAKEFYKFNYSQPFINPDGTVWWVIENEFRRNETSYIEQSKGNFGEAVDTKGNMLALCFDRAGKIIVSKVIQKNVSIKYGSVFNGLSSFIVMRCQQRLYFVYSTHKKNLEDQKKVFEPLRKEADGITAVTILDIQTGQVLDHYGTTNVEDEDRLALSPVSNSLGACIYLVRKDDFRKERLGIVKLK